MIAHAQSELRPGGGSSRPRQSIFGRHAPAWAQSSARAVGYAFVQETPAGWREAAQLLTLLAPLDARTSLAVAALGALPEHAAAMVSEAFIRLHGDSVGPEAIGANAGVSPPQPDILGIAEEAADWARFASPVELRAYFGAVWRALSPADRQAVLDHIRGRRRDQPR